MQIVKSLFCAAPDKTIILGAHLIDPHSLVSEGAVIYNLEQIVPDSPWMTEDYISLLKQREVWDYSRQNIKTLKELGIEAKYCGIGYAPELTNIPKCNQDIDVLFYGSINERRMKVCNELAKHCNVHVAYDKYGEERDKLIARAKVVLNIHFYPSKVFEIVRCSYLFANRKCVVSEYGSDAELEYPFDEQGVRFSEYENLISECLYLLRGDEDRQKIADDGFKKFSSMKQSNYLQSVL